jgi:type I restriction enzyme S subunit
MSKTFFLPGETDNAGYRNIRDGEKPIEVAIKAFVERLWTEYEPYCGDNHFLIEAKTQFLQRFWEMYLAVGFLEAGYTLEKTDGAQPDILINHQGRRIWIEAVCPNLGNGPNAVPSLNAAAYEAKQQGKGAVVMDYPDLLLIQRYTAKIRDKYQQYRKWLEKGIVSAGEPFIIAINSAGLEFGDINEVVTQLARSVLGFEHLRIPFTVNEEEAKPEGEPFWSMRETVKTASGEEIQVDTFMKGVYPEISGLIGAKIDAANSPGFSGKPLLTGFELLHNPTTNNPLSSGVFPCLIQKEVRDGYLGVILDSPR